MIRRRIRSLALVERSYWFVVASAWMMLGLVTFGKQNSLPYAGSGVWLVSSSIVAGSALAVARHQSRFSFILYLACVIAMGIARSVGYWSVGVWSPMIVWMIVILGSVRSVPRAWRHSE